MLIDLILVKDGAAVGIEADGKEGREHVGALCAESRGLLRKGDGMVANDGEVERVGREGSVLKRDPIAEGAEVVAEMRDAGGLNA